MYILYMYICICIYIYIYIVKMYTYVYIYTYISINVRHLKLVAEKRETLMFEIKLGRMIAVRAAGDVQFPACRAFTARVRPAHTQNYKATWKRKFKLPWRKAGPL